MLADVIGSMSLIELLKGFISEQQLRAIPQNCEVKRLVLNSQEVEPGDVFVALKGHQLDGRDYINQALEKGAKAVLCELHPGESIQNFVEVKDPVKNPIIVLEHLGNQLGHIADKFYQSPSSALTVVGVTGTNGKTSTAHYIAQACAALGDKAATMGTLGTGLVDERLTPSRNTTPDALEVHASMAALKAKGVQSLAMEVSSHALSQRRVDGVAFDYAVFTNLSRDHLDYHKTMEAYQAAKQRLLDWPTVKSKVINADDAVGFAYLMAHGSDPRLIAYSIDPQRNMSDFTHYLQARCLRLSSTGLHLELESSWGNDTLKCSLLGRFNAQNVLATLGVLLALGAPLKRAVSAVEKLKPVVGRMQCVNQGGHPRVVIDYAHTPDALEQALVSLKEHCSGKLILVFGCGGDRDKGKRPLMGSVAESYSDTIVITDDNPRSESSKHIIRDILAGIKQPQKCIIEPDRAKAIERAIISADPQDIILVAGKGHEEYQQVGPICKPFSDIEASRKVLEVL